MRKDMCLGFTERTEEVTSILWERILRVMAVNPFLFSRGNDQGSRVGRLCFPLSHNKQLWHNV